MKVKPRNFKFKSLTPSHYNYDQVEDSKSYKKIIGLSSTDSSYLIQTIPSIKSYRDPDFPGLLVFLEYLSAFEVNYGGKKGSVVEKFARERISL